MSTTGLATLTPLSLALNPKHSNPKPSFEPRLPFSGVVGQAADRQRLGQSGRAEPGESPSPPNQNSKPSKPKLEDPR